MTYAMSGPTMLTQVMLGVVASLESELPDVRSRTIVAAVAGAHDRARKLLPDLVTYAESVTRFARESLSPNLIASRGEAFVQARAAVPLWSDR
jgi:hypothetical protein